MEKIIRNIVMIGSGNMAYHLIRSFRNTGRKVIQLYARKSERSATLSSRFRVPLAMNPEELRKDGDLYVLAVKDDAISELAGQMNLGDRLVVHTSGATPLSAIRGISEETGVFYPLQSLSFGKDIDFTGIPVCIEASDRESLRQLHELAQAITGNVWELDSVRRQHLHLAAVFAANFTQRMYLIASAILEDQNIPFEILGPLINETTRKAIYNGPRKDLTGPAVRKDMKIIEQHMKMLEKHPEFLEIYRQITENIMKNKD